MENTIATRIYDFLKEYPPFSFISGDLLMGLCEQVIVQYRQPNEVIYRQGDVPGQRLFVVREGAVHLVREEEEGPSLIEQCDEGDVFGIQPLFAQDNYLLTARVAEESLLYAIDTEGVKNILESHPRVAYYLANAFAAGVRTYAGEVYRGKLFLEKERLTDASFHLLEVQSMEQSKKPVVCSRETTIESAASIMSREEVGSIIVVNTEQHPLGIVTDKDLRRQVATGKTGIDRPVRDIMSSPVITVRPEVTVADVQIEMVKHRIHHLCLTEDGTVDSRVVGVLSEHDLLVIQGNNPAILIREIRRGNTAGDLRRIRERAEILLSKYLYQEVSIAYISVVMTEINDALIGRAVELSLAEMKAEGFDQPGTSFCWLALGSEGREEQLLRTDQDSALVFENVAKDKYEQVKNYYLVLAGKVTEKLHLCGFEYCPADMMASNPQWCLSLDEWKKQFASWIIEPSPKAVMYCTIFFDYRPVFGEKQLADSLTEHIFSLIEKESIFLSFLAKNALENPPPLTFFRSFVVESSGEHKDEFDIKARAMMPLADAARVLILEARVGKINNTFRRFKKLAELEPQNEELYELAADAYEVLMRYRTLQGLRHQNSGRYFNPSQLTKVEKMNLRNSFRPIKDMQSLLNSRFRLSYLR